MDAWINLMFLSDGINPLARSSLSHIQLGTYLSVTICSLCSAVAALGGPPLRATFKKETDATLGLRVPSESDSVFKLRLSVAWISSNDWAQNWLITSAHHHTCEGFFHEQSSWTRKRLFLPSLSFFSISLTGVRPVWVFERWFSLPSPASSPCFLPQGLTPINLSHFLLHLGICFSDDPAKTPTRLQDKWK